MKKIISKIMVKILNFLLILPLPSIKKLKKTDEFIYLSEKYKKNKLEIAKNNFKFNKEINLSFVVTTYNSEKYIEKCIYSLLNQETSYKCEIIVVDDGSTDNTLNILKIFKNIKVFKNKHSGISKTRNFGLSKVTGEYVAFVDSDDFIAPNYVERVLVNAYKNNSDVLKFGYYIYNFKKKNIISKSKDMISNTYTKLGKNILNYPGYAWGQITKTILFNDISFPENYDYEDMINRILVYRKAKTFTYINERLYYYSQHGNNISKKLNSSKNLDQFYLFQELYHLSNKMNLRMDEELYLTLLYEASTMLFLRTRHLKKSTKKYLFSLSSDFITKINYKCELNKDEEKIYKIFKNKNYTKFNIYCIYKILKTRCGE